MFVNDFVDYKSGQINYLPVCKQFRVFLTNAKQILNFNILMLFVGNWQGLFMFNKNSSLLSCQYNYS